MNNKETKKIAWSTLAFMAFSTVWGFGNVVNGFSEFGGLKAIVSWVIIFAIYFVPYALMVGVPCKQIGWVSKAGNTLKFDKAGIATDSFDNSRYKIENDNIVLLGE